MDRNLEIALVSALLAALFGSLVVFGLREGNYPSDWRFTQINREKAPFMFWVSMSALAAFAAVMAYISIGSFLSRL